MAIEDQVTPLTVLSTELIPERARLAHGPSEARPMTELRRTLWILLLVCSTVVSPVSAQSRD